MELRTIGHSSVVKGQLLTLYVTDPNNAGDHYFTLLYVKEAFDVSAQMAAFYAQLDDKTRCLPIEKNTEGFYLYLLKQGLVERPRSNVIHMGEAGRANNRLTQEYRYSLNPVEFIIDTLNNGLMYQSRSFVSEQGYRYMLVGPSCSFSEVVATIDVNGETIGSIHMGIAFDRTLDAELSQRDLKRMTAVLMDMIKEVGCFPGLSVSNLQLSLAPLIEPS